MTIYRRENGEKATLLNKCGESLFGCSGKLLCTQGIYVPKSLLPGPSHCFCKRTVWVPDSLSQEYLLHHLELFGATLPFSVQWAVSLHRFGLCGVIPTRTVHATDKHFLLLAKVPHKHFAVYGIVELRKTDHHRRVFIENISTNKDDVLSCVDWIKSEITLFLLSKKNRIRDDGFIDERGDKDSKILEAKSEKPIQVSAKEQDLIQHQSTETESDVSVHTPEYPTLVPCEYVIPQTSSFNGVYLPSPNTILLIPFLPPQSTAESQSD